jgi:hypothetical protein
MKKAIVVLFALAFVGAMAFADGPKTTMSGYVEAGVALSATSAGTTLVQAANDDGPMNFGVTTTMGDFSATFAVEYGVPDWTTIQLSAANLTYNFLNKMITVTAGKGAGGVGSTPIEGWGGSGVDGVGLYVTPITGLSLGYGLPVDWTATDISTQLNKSAIGAAYSMANLFDIDLSFNLDGVLTAGLNITAVKGLTAQVDAAIDTKTAGQTKDGQDMQYEENFAYAINKLTVGVDLTQQIKTSLLTMTFDPTVSYALGVPTVGAGVTVTVPPSGGTIAFKPDANVAFAFNSAANLKLDVNYDTGASAFGVGLTFWQTF